ncbi:DEAD-box ATP-dependent RNA helicase CshA [bacterium HR41]|nr:DEAD-box ATP-dependent RNA helicase CshA [bacterium HR41]
MGGASEFARLGLEDTIVRALERLGYGPPTPIQERAIPYLLAGRDVIGQAQTGRARPLRSACRSCSTSIPPTTPSRGSC